MKVWGESVGQCKKHSLSLRCTHICLLVHTRANSHEAAFPTSRRSVEKVPSSVWYSYTWKMLYSSQLRNAQVYMDFNSTLLKIKLASWYPLQCRSFPQAAGKCGYLVTHEQLDYHKDAIVSCMCLCKFAEHPETKQG